MADHPLDPAILNAIKGLAHFIPTRVIAPADPVEAEDLANDLREIADVIDPLIKAFGDYAAEYFDIDKATFKECFESPLMDALDGNAIHVLKRAAQDLEAERHNEELLAAERRRYSIADPVG